MPQATVILICDDDADDRFLAQEAFREAGVDATLEFTDTAEGLEDRLRASPPKLVLLDLNMPRVDGRQALERLRAADLLEKIPVVVVTTSGAREDVDLCMRLGARSFIRKPRRFTDYVRAARVLGEYWLEVVE